MSKTNQKVKRHGDCINELAEQFKVKPEQVQEVADTVAVEQLKAMSIEEFLEHLKRINGRR